MSEQPPVDEERLERFVSAALAADYAAGMKRAGWSEERILEVTRSTLRGWLTYSVRDRDKAVLRWREPHITGHPREVAY